VARRLGVQIVQVWTCDLTTITEPRWDDSYAFCHLDCDDLLRLAADPVNDLPACMASRLAAGGNRCFASWDGPNLACYAWSCEGAVNREDSMGIPLVLPANAYYFFKAFALPTYRGRGIYMLTAKRAMAELSRGGKSTGIAIIEFGNVLSMRVHDRLGLKPEGWIIRLGWGKRAFHWYSRSARRRGFGRRHG
jgi:hypothetical protein